MILDISFKLDTKEFPMLKNFKKKELDDYLLKVFRTGYLIHFPPTNKIKQKIEYKELIERIETIKTELVDEINNSEVGDKINSLESSLTKLIGLSSNSCKKGAIAENILEELFSNRYGDIRFERKSGQAHSGDAWLHLPDNKIIMLESKNYATTVNKDEISKLHSDMITHNIRWSILVSFNSMIQGMKELDFQTFVHNKETYSVIMISNLSVDIHKLDLGLQIIRKLIGMFDNMHDFPWIIKDITQGLNELNQIIQKNYCLRDSYYTLERDIQKLLSSYHVTLRDYQYEIELKINEITKGIQTTMQESIKLTNNNNQDILDKYTNKKILPLVSRLIDVIHEKKWQIIYNTESDERDYSIYHNNNEIAKCKIQTKKVIFTYYENDITLTLHLDKDKENKQNLNIIKLL